MSSLTFIHLLLICLSVVKVILLFSFVHNHTKSNQRVTNIFYSYDCIVIRILCSKHEHIVSLFRVCCKFSHQSLTQRLVTKKFQSRWLIWSLNVCCMKKFKSFVSPPSERRCCGGIISLDFQYDNIFTFEVSNLKMLRWCCVRE